MSESICGQIPMPRVDMLVAERLPDQLGNRSVDRCNVTKALNRMYLCLVGLAGYVMIKDYLYG